MKKSKVTINNWENGKTEIDYGNLNELCRLYSVTMDDILLPYQSTLSRKKEMKNASTKQTRFIYSK